MPRDFGKIREGIMGGFGSGGHNRVAGTVEGSRTLDVMKLHRAGSLRPGYWGTWQWSYQDGTTATIQQRANESEIVLIYKYRPGFGDWEPVEQRVPIDWTACRYGGSRPWFRCVCFSGGQYCGKRVAKLYGAGKLFACRHCYRLGYQSQLEREHLLPLHTANKLRKKLGGDPGMASPIPKKPKGMHWRTYNAAVERILTLEIEAEGELEEVILRMEARWSRARGRRRSHT
ncbi:hypothetical protein [Niveispirillum cyanobacteriorum]|uniref:Uncharacterized protein n=2 Tax=Niveispirillum cyanobacteriorum TaxID=1612173 RepID=A0A2K9NB38_9PROT|nr:hypothetical protein [Niveispirillum cyanobacteriorum]AUN30297.1 hypothetical protein C0V82_08680 [Niveispirillum cyanobacteriorum]GGE56012.1 hypothetical protein GCM10011317_12570 [Niveispirillum cyanobacteriorum]